VAWGDFQKVGHRQQPVDKALSENGNPKLTTLTELTLAAGVRLTLGQH